MLQLGKSSLNNDDNNDGESQDPIINEHGNGNI